MTLSSFAVFLQEAVLCKEEVPLCFPCRPSSLGFYFHGGLIFKNMFSQQNYSSGDYRSHLHSDYELSWYSVCISFNGPFSHLPFSSAGTVPGVSALGLFFVQHSEMGAQLHTLSIILLPGTQRGGLGTVLTSPAFSSSWLWLLHRFLPRTSLKSLFPSLGITS